MFFSLLFPKKSRSFVEDGARFFYCYQRKNHVFRDSILLQPSEIDFFSKYPRPYWRGRTISQLLACFRSRVGNSVDPDHLVS